MLLALHGLRTEELMSVTYGDLRQLAGGEGHVLQVDTAKRERSVREVPVSEELVELMHTIWSAGGLRQSQDLVDVAKRTVRHWISDARDELEWEHSDEIGMHDLRRTWATDTYYTLALAGVPIAEQLTMTWGGWTMSETGRSTFRQTYLGPVPDHIVADVAERLPG
jgi:integrase